MAVRNLVLVGLLLQLAASGVQGQSPWARRAGGFYTQLGVYTISNYDELFSERSGAERSTPWTQSETTVQFYGEYGITSRATVFTALPLRRVTAGEPLRGSSAVVQPGDLWGMGNVSLGLRYQLLRGAWPLAATLRLDAPSNRYDDRTGLRTGYPAFAAVPMLSTGQGYGSFYWFVHGGYGYRSNGYSDFVQGGLEAGARFWRLWLIGGVDAVAPVGDDTRTVPLANAATGLFVDQQGYLSPAVKLMARLGKEWNVTLSANTALWAQNLPKRPAFGLSVGYSME